MVRFAAIALAILVAMLPVQLPATTEFGDERCADALVTTPEQQERLAAADLAVARLRREGAETPGTHGDPEWGDLVRWHRWWLSHPVVSPVIGHEAMHAYFGRALGPLHALSMHAHREGARPELMRKLWLRRLSGTLPWDGALAIRMRDGQWRVLDPRAADEALDLEHWWRVHRGDFVEGRAEELRVTDVSVLEPAHFSGPSYHALFADVRRYEIDPAFVAERNRSVLELLAMRHGGWPGLGRRSHFTVEEVRTLADWLGRHPVASDGALAARGLFAGACHLQAFAVALKAERLGLASDGIAKVWAYGSFRPAPDTDWGFHVATAVRTHGGWWVVDGGTGPLPLDHWVQWLRAADPYGVRRFAVTEATAFDTFGSPLFDSGFRAYQEQFFGPLVESLLMEDPTLHNADDRSRVLGRYPALRPAFEPHRS